MPARIKVTHRRTVVLQTCREQCPVERGMRVIGGRWKGSILWQLRDGPVRFNDLARQLGGASRKMINERLKEMESLGLVNRTVRGDRPISVTYQITEFGRSSLRVLEELREWVRENNV